VAGAWCGHSAVLGLGGAVLGLMLALPARGSPIPTLRIVQAPGRVPWRHFPQGGVWTRATLIRKLVQQSPDPGAATRFVTTVKLLRGRRALYVAFFNRDPYPGGISVNTLLRDASQDNDDHVSLVLDPDATGQLGYVFQVNAGGARRDGLLAPGRTRPEWQWNGLWDVRVWRRSWGWVALLRIPYSTLRFNPGHSGWKMNLARMVPRRQLMLTWAGHRLNSNVFDLRQAGRLLGMAGIAARRHWFFTPYVVAEAGGGGARQKAGITLKGTLTPRLTGVLTVRPDFAEAEAPSAQLNLTPYPLFIPETRAFFLEGANLFAFAPGLSDRLIPFYSRQVGQVDGVVIPVLAGAKLVGRSGLTSVGVMDVQTTSGAGVGPQNLFAGALAWPLPGGLRIGTLVTHGDPTGTSDNTFLGMDAAWETTHLFGDRNFNASAWTARSVGNPVPGYAGGWGARVSYPNDLWTWHLSYNQFGPALYPALGFLPRPGIRTLDGGFAYQPRPNPLGHFGWARQFFYEFYGHYTAATTGELLDWRFFVTPFNFQLADGTHFEVNWMPHFQRLTQAFEVASNVTIPAGDYRYNRYRIQANSPAGRTWQIGGTIHAGRFYNGRLTQVDGSVAYATPGGHWSVRLSAESVFGRLPEGDFVLRLYGLGLTWAGSPAVTLSNSAQYDTISHRVSVKSIFRWHLRPGSDLYLVWNHDVPVITTNNPEGNGVTGGNQLVAKLAWTFS